MRKVKVPKYSLHKGTGQARVQLKGKDYWLGKHGSPESYERYSTLIHEWQQALENPPSEVTFGQLSLLYRKHSERHYTKNGKHTSEVNLISLALKRMNKTCRKVPLAKLSPRHLKQVREEMIADGLSRETINKFTQRIRRAVKWAVGEELCPASVLIALQAVQDLRRGRSAAVESVPVRPVPEERVFALQPHVAKNVWGLIHFQLLTGARPGEARILRGRDLNQIGEVWEYRPESHKTEHHGRERVLVIGKRGQELLSQYLTDDPDAYVFRSDSKGKRCYRRDSYRNAIIRGCEAAFNMPEELRDIRRYLIKLDGLTDDQKATLKKKLEKKASVWRGEHCWSPNQLRHNFATLARKQFGIEAARVLLGHSSAVTTEIYAERDIAKAAEVIAEIG